MRGEEEARELQQVGTGGTGERGGHSEYQVSIS